MQNRIALAAIAPPTITARVKGGSTLSILINTVARAVKAAFSKSLIRKGNQQ